MNTDGGEVQKEGESAFIFTAGSGRIRWYWAQHQLVTMVFVAAKRHRWSPAVLPSSNFFHAHFHVPFCPPFADSFITWMSILPTDSQGPDWPPGLPREASKKFPSAVYALMRLQFAGRMGEHLTMSSRKQKPVQNVSAESRPTAAETKKKILVVDDDPVTVKALTLALTSKGYEVSSASDGSEAIGVVRNDIPDMLLVDVNLEPQDAFGGAALFDGFQVTRWLRNVTAKNIPAIIISATDKADYRTYAAKIGAETFLAKPISNATLLQAIESGLAAPSAMTGNSARV